MAPNSFEPYYGEPDNEPLTEEQLRQRAEEDAFDEWRYEQAEKEYIERQAAADIDAEHKYGPIDWSDNPNVPF